jgi:hypothetical protein
VRSALEPKGIKDIDVDCSSKTCTFKAPADLDLDATLNELADMKQFKGWTRK